MSDLEDEIFILRALQAGCGCSRFPTAFLQLRVRRVSEVEVDPSFNFNLNSVNDEEPLRFALTEVRTQRQDGTGSSQGQNFQKNFSRSGVKVTTRTKDSLFAIRVNDVQKTPRVPSITTVYSGSGSGTSVTVTTGPCRENTTTATDTFTNTFTLLDETAGIFKWVTDFTSEGTFCNQEGELENFSNSDSSSRTTSFPWAAGLPDETTYEYPDAIDAAEWIRQASMEIAGAIDMIEARQGDPIYSRFQIFNTETRFGVEGDQAEVAFLIPANFESDFVEVKFDLAFYPEDEGEPAEILTSHVVEWTRPENAENIEDEFTESILLPLPSTVGTVRVVNARYNLLPPNPRFAPLWNAFGPLTERGLRGF